MTKLQSVKDYFRSKDFGNKFKGILNGIFDNSGQLVLWIVFFFGLWWFLGSPLSDKITFTTGGDLVVTESKTFWGGVWFNKDVLIISPAEFTIEKKSIIRGSTIYSIPTSKIRKVIFEEGFNNYKIIIVSEGGIFDNRKKLVLINKDNFDTVKLTIFDLCKNQFETEETKTLLNRFSEILLEI